MNVYAISFVLIIIFAYWILLLHTFYLIIKNFRSAEGAKRNQLKYFIVGLSIGWVGAHGDFIPALGFDVYPYSNYLIVIYPIILSYAIIRHQLMDIQLVFKKSLVYSLLITSISIIFLISVLISERLFQGLFGYQTRVGSILAAVLIAIAFTPLKNRIQFIVDKFFFKGTPLEIAQQNELLRREVAKSERFKAATTLASGMAHEIKNPLTAVKTFTEYLPQKLDDKEFLNKFSNIVGSEVNRIDGLVNQLLDFAKPAPLQLKTTNINTLVHETLNFLSNNFIKNKIKVVENFNPKDEILISVDPNQIKQALLNIFLNAIDAMPEGGRLTTSIHLQSSNPTHVVISIEDTGCGISKNNLSHIFDPFFSKKDNGTGLGLAIVHGIVQEHCGKIKVESEISKGTKFIIKLPLRH